MAFGLKYFTEFRSKYKGVFWRTEIAEDDYMGPSEEMTSDGNEPLSITWEKRGDEFFVPIKGSEATINILCSNNFHYIDLFTSDPRRYRVSVYRNLKLYWRGYIVSDLYSENFSAPPYVVSIKAVDGFNLLNSIPFIEINNKITGRKSLWDLVLSCINLLELDVSITDWMDLYTSSMDENISPLKQTYIDLDRFYALYDNPTYRDVLELCLKPFAAQMFQSNGSINIRRSVSLYKENRPYSFYDISGEFPSGWLITADGKTITTHEGEPIITQVSRDKIDSVWDKTINILNDSVLDILPAIRNINITVSNKLLSNMLSNIGMFNKDNWIDPKNILNIGKNTIHLMGNTDAQGTYVEFKGYTILQSTVDMELTINLFAWINTFSLSGEVPEPSENKQLPFEYGFKIVGESKTIWLKDDGMWSDNQVNFKDNIELRSETDKKIEIKGFPMKGNFIFYIKQTLMGFTNDRYSKSEHIKLNDISLSIISDNDYEDDFKYNSLVNSGNNVDIDITLPSADIPNIPNDTLLYSLYFTDSNGQPTRLWKNRGMNDYNSLVNHIVYSCLLYKQLASKRISGKMFTGKHIDMNTVAQDDKYLMSGFYVNSIELSCLTDEYNSELVEMPKLLHKEIPSSGDDCVRIYNTPNTIKNSVICNGDIIILDNKGAIYKLDLGTYNSKLIYQSTATANIYPGDSSIAIVDNNKYTIINNRGNILETNPYENQNVSTYMRGYGYILKREFGRDGYYHVLNRPKYDYNSDPHNTNVGYNRQDILATSMYGDVINLIKTPNTITINTTKKAYVHDTRLNVVELMNEHPEGSEIKSISDYFMAMNQNNEFKVYRRDNFNDSVLIMTRPEKAQFATHTMGQVAYVLNNTINIWDYGTTNTYTVKNNEAASEKLKDIFYINGYLYIIRDKTIFKLIQ